jgi:hypothetical protein
MSPAAPATIITPTLRRRRGLTEQAAVDDAQAYGSILPAGFPKESGGASLTCGSEYQLM